MSNLNSTYSTYIRVDVFEDNMGQLIGFYESIDQIPIDYQVSKDLSRDELERSGNFVQLTTFMTYKSYGATVEGWYNGEILNSYYFEEINDLRFND